MLPIVRIGFFSISTFQVILVISFYFCYAYLLFAKPYNWLYRRDYIHMMVWALVSGAIGGKLLSAFTLYIQDNSKSFFYYIVHGGSVFYGILVTGFCVAYDTVSCIAFQGQLDDSQKGMVKKLHALFKENAANMYDVYQQIAPEFIEWMTFQTV